MDHGKNTNAYQHLQEIGGSVVKSSFVLPCLIRQAGIKVCAWLKMKCLLTLQSAQVEIATFG
jgi:hypothetical protein